MRHHPFSGGLYGYTVLPAGDGEEALRVAGEHKGEIHLVLTHHGVLEEGKAFLQKPYSSISLAQKVKEVLETQG